MSNLYRHSKIWISTCGGVIGFDPDELNHYISEYNRLMYRFSDFWEYLSYELNQYLSGFSTIWNNGNPLMSQLKTIRKSELEVLYCDR